MSLNCSAYVDRKEKCPQNSSAYVNRTEKCPQTVQRTWTGRRNVLKQLSVRGQEGEMSSNSGVQRQEREMSLNSIASTRPRTELNSAMKRQTEKVKSAHHSCNVQLSNNK